MVVKRIIPHNSIAMKIFRTIFRSMGLLVALVLFFGTYFYLQANVFVSKDSDQNKFVSTANATAPSGIGNPACTDNYLSWTNSTTFKTNTPWSTAFVVAPTNTLTNGFERDINGDGLPDYVYVNHSANTASNNEQDCVYLSNGTGWTKAYQCVAVAGTTPRYYGDCAG